MNDGGPAFPHPSLWGAAADGTRYKLDAMMSGMSLRDWFAGQALSGSINCPTELTINGREVATLENFAEWSYAMADAMLAARDSGATTQPKGATGAK